MAVTTPLQSDLYLQVGALFQELGLLVGTNQTVAAPKRVAVDTVLELGMKAEPRFLSVLPAALLAVPERFTGLKNMDPTLREILARLRDGYLDGPALGPIPFGELRRWAESSLKDRRRKPVALKKRGKSFRLTPRALRRLKELSEKRGLTETEIIEELLQQSS